VSSILQVPASTANYTATRLGYSVRGVIIHTVVGSLASADSAFQDPNRGASAHYGIPYNGYNDGPIHQYVAESNTAWQCGRFYPDASDPLANVNTIGIEHADNGAYASPRPEALYVCSAQLVFEICQRYGIPIDRTHIRKHLEVSQLSTSCPDTLDIDHIVYLAQQLANPTPAPQEDDDMLYVGPVHALAGTVSVFAPGSRYHDPSVSALGVGSLAQSAAVAVSGYRFSSSAVQSSDRGAGAGAGPDYVWWQASDGSWIPDAILDTSALAGAPIGAAVSSLPSGMATYFALAGAGGGGGADDDSAYVTQTQLASALAALPKPPTKGSGTAVVNVTLS
jgi:N-acetylmuramoyl-L-alanine amidase